jgi:flavorubredoxin
MRRLWKIVLVVFLVLVVLVVSVFTAFAIDLSSYGATDSKSLNPTGTSIGRALVVYDPGFSGAAKQDATKIAEDLQTKGYTVNLAGVRSGTAGEKSGYDIIVAGGPMYWGEVSSSIDGYLKTVPNSVKLGVFGSTSSSTLYESDYTSLLNQVASATHNENAAIKLTRDGNETSDCADLVSKLVQQG